MILADESLLDEFRASGRCELCGLTFARREPHHLLAKGVGGGGRVDHRLNVLATGPHEQYRCRCHRLVHDGVVPRHLLWKAVALREGCTPEQAELAMRRVQNAPKGADYLRIVAEAMA